MDQKQLSLLIAIPDNDGLISTPIYLSRGGSKRNQVREEDPRKKGLGRVMLYNDEEDDQGALLVGYSNKPLLTTGPDNGF